MMRTALRLGLCLTLIGSAGCLGTEEEIADDTRAVKSNSEGQSQPQLERGRDIWFNNTYGGGHFFNILRVTGELDVALDEVIHTPRHLRHQVWGTINDPDCEANPEGAFLPDVCDDPNATGVVGIRRELAGEFGPAYDAALGVSCAGCHAGFDPTNPPADVNEPEWDNIHATIGNQNLETGKMFAANLDLSDPVEAVRAAVFASWEPGTVDTTALFSDGINNPGTITAFWEHPHRNTFEVQHLGVNVGAKLRNGQGGEDDVGGDIAALRVYTNIGVCFQECTAPAMATDQPIDISACYANCDNFPPPQDLADLSAFLASFEAPEYPGAIDDRDQYRRGEAVFEANCASCHDNGGGHLKRVLSNDEMNSLFDLGVTGPQVFDASPQGIQARMAINATNVCRALSTNWDPGEIWAEFTSATTHARALNGTKGYRNMPLSGIWATSPLLHNNSIGDEVPGDATPAERAAAFDQAMDLLLNPSLRQPDIDFITIPGLGTVPLAYVVNDTDANGNLKCADIVNNAGHNFGAGLSPDAKDDLKYYLLYQ